MYIHAMVEGRNTYSGAGSIRVHGTAGSLKGKASHDDGYVPCKGVWHDFGREFSCSVGLFDPGATRAQSPFAPFDHNLSNSAHAHTAHGCPNRHNEDVCCS